jgi:hypothetical protein
MSTINNDIEMTRGDSATFDLTLIEPDPDPDPVPLNLTGCDLRFTAKYSPDDTDAQAVFSVTNGVGDAISSAVPASGVALIELSPSHTSSMPQGARLYYDVQIKKQNSKTYTVASGRLNVRADITRTT